MSTPSTTQERLEVRCELNVHVKERDVPICTTGLGGVTLMMGVSVTTKEKEMALIMVNFCRAVET